MKLLWVDSDRLVRNLRSAGFSGTQAEALIAAMLHQVAMRDSADHHLSVSTLQRGGFNDEQANALVEASEDFVSS